MKVHSHPTIPSLDGLRAVSILVVFAAHAGISDLLPGGFGVTIFFFLSGFLITSLFYAEVGRTGGINLKAFYIRRLMRLSPPLYITLAITYALVASGIVRGTLAPGAILSQIFYFFNYYTVFVPGSTEGAYGLTVLWSLSVEEHFYMIYPWLFVLLLRDRLGLGHMGALLLGFLIWRLIRVLLTGAEHQEIYMSTDTRFDAILYGAFLAMLNARGLSQQIFPQGNRGRNLMLLGALAVLLLSFVWRDHLFRLTLRYTLQSAALTPFFYYAVTRPDLWYFRPLNWTPLRWIGIYSYTIYLCHTVILGSLQYNHIAADNRLLFALLGGLLSLGYAAALYHGVEQPLKRWRSQRRRAGAVGT